MPPTTCCTFTHSYTTFRIVRTISDTLVLERCLKDSMGEARWDLADLKHTLETWNFKESGYWGKAYQIVSIPTSGGHMLDTRSAPMIPVSCQGIVYNYSSRNDHAPDDDEQDVYYKTEARGMAFTSHVPVMAQVPTTNVQLRQQILLGVVFLLVCTGEVPSGHC